MPFPGLDIRTIQWFLVVVNLIVMAMFIFTKIREATQYLSEALWLEKHFRPQHVRMLSMSGDVPFILSAHDASTRIFFGIYSEIVALWRLYLINDYRKALHLR